MNMTSFTPHSSLPPTAGPATGTRFSPVDPLRLLRRHARLIGVVIVGSAVFGVVLWLLLRFYMPSYTSEVQLSVTGGVTDPYQTMQQEGGGLTQSHMELIEAFIQNQTIRLGSDDIVNEVLKRTAVRESAWFKSFAGGEDGRVNTRKAREDFKDRLSASPIRGSTYISVTFSAFDEQDPPIVLDQLIDVYLNKLALETDRESDSVRLTFVQERDRAERELKQIQDEMKLFAVQNDLPNLESRGHEATIAYQTLAEQIAALEVQLEAARDLYQSFLAMQQAGQTIQSSEVMAEIQKELPVAQRDEDIRRLKETRAVYIARFGENHRTVTEIDQRILASEDQKQKEIERLLRERQVVMLDQAKAAVDAIESQLAGLRQKLEETTTRMRDLNLLIEEYHRKEELAEAAAERRAKAEDLLNSVRIQTTRPDSTRVRMVLNPTEPELTFPRPEIVIPLSVVLLTGLVVGGLFLREMLDQRVRSPEDVRQLQGCELLGVLPDAAEDPSGQIRVEGAVEHNPTGLMAECFRQVRAALLAQMERRNLHSVMFVGAQAQAGTSVVVNNLAASLATNGKKVLVIDANLRRPAQHRLNNTNSAPGFVEVLAGTAGLEQAVVHVPSIDVDLLPVGQMDHGTPDLLEGAAFADLIRQLEGRYDLVLLDAPPALLTSEASMLAKHVDAVVIVVRAMADMRGMIHRMLRQFTDRKAVVLGVILNRVWSSAGGYFRRSYEEFYRYRQGDGRAQAQLAARASAMEQAASRR